MGNMGTVTVPEWDLADRMRKALRTSGISVGEMADYLGVGRNTVSTWINGRIAPSRQTLRLWAIRCGVSYEWLVGGLPRLDSNQEPAGYGKYPTFGGIAAGLAVAAM